MGDILRLVLVSTCLVDDYDALEEGVNRKLGVTLAALPNGRHAFTPTNEAFDVRDRAEYRKHVRLGEMAPADEATAKILGVKFNASALPKAAPSPAAAPDTSPTPTADAQAIPEAAPTDSAKTTAKSGGKDK